MPSVSTRFPRPPSLEVLVGPNPTPEDLSGAYDEITRWAADLVRELEELQAQLEQPASTGWAMTNFTEKRDLNAGTAALADVANVVATLIEDLRERGDLEN